MSQTVVTVTANGKLLKPQLVEEGKLRDWTDSNVVIGSSNKRDRSFAHSYELEEELPRIFERNGITDDWAKELVPAREK